MQTISIAKLAKPRDPEHTIYLWIATIFRQSEKGFMPDPTEQLLELLRTHYGLEDVIVDENQPTLRLNLHPEVLEMWEAEYDYSRDSNDNLLLACNNSAGPIESASLTWIVGSAIRRAKVDSLQQCQHLLQSLGLEPNMASAITRNCPGIAMGVIWAIYYERHGHVVASPVLSSEKRNKLKSTISTASA